MTDPAPQSLPWLRRTDSGLGSPISAGSSGRISQGLVTNPAPDLCRGCAAPISQEWGDGAASAVLHEGGVT